MGSARSIAYNAPHEVLTVALSPLELCLSNTLNGKKPGGGGLMPASPDFRGESPSLINSADPALSAPTRTKGPASIPCSPYRALQRARHLRPAAQRLKSAIVPIAADALRISPVPAQVGTRAHRDGTNGGNGNESAKRHTGNDRAVIG